MSTLLKIFFLPRVKTMLWQVVLINIICIIALYFKNFQIAAFCGIGFVYVVAFNLFNVNFTENLEWMRNSAYSPKRLLKYYFFEQTLMFAVTLFFLIFSIFGVALALAFTKVKASDVDPGINHKEMMTLLGPLYEKAQSYISTSATENALEVLFFVLIITSFIYGAQIIKAYFMSLKYEKKFSREQKFFQILMLGTMFFFITMDKFDFILKFKIIAMPLILAVNAFAIIYATNQIYKLFNPKKNSPLYMIPAGIFGVIFTVTISFSSFNYINTKNVNEKIAEHRFLGIFAPSLSKDFITPAYSANLSDSSLEYLMKHYPLENSTKDFYKIINSKGLEQKILLTKMWDLEKLNEVQKSHLLTKIEDDFLLLETDINKYKMSRNFLSINKDFLEKNPDYQKFNVAKFKLEKEELPRLPASVK